MARSSTTRPCTSITLLSFVTPGPDGHPYEVVSFGKDGQPGGEDENKDISSTNLGGT